MRAVTELDRPSRWPSIGPIRLLTQLGSSLSALKLPAPAVEDAADLLGADDRTVW